MGFVRNIKLIEKQAGAELGKAQVKLSAGAIIFYRSCIKHELIPVEANQTPEQWVAVHLPEQRLYFSSIHMQESSSPSFQGFVSDPPSPTQSQQGSEYLGARRSLTDWPDGCPGCRPGLSPPPPPASPELLHIF